MIRREFIFGFIVVTLIFSADIGIITVLVIIGLGVEGIDNISISAAAFLFLA